MMVHNKMQGLTDIHCHILPYVDDGARTMEEALELISMQKEQGVSAIFLTPHRRKDMFGTSSESVKKHFVDLQREIAQMPDAPRLYLGRECYCDSAFQSLLLHKNVQEIRSMVYEGSNGILVEFSHEHSLQNVLDYINLIRKSGMIPIIAHLERYDYLVDCLEVVEDLIRRGALIQVNTMSILGEDGRMQKKIAKELLKNDMVHFVGSDAHRSDVRMPQLGDCVRYLSKKISKQQLDKIFYENPSLLLKSK